MISPILFKMGKHSDFHLSFFQIVGAWRDLTDAKKLIKNFKSLYGFGGRFFKIRDVCMDFEPYFKIHTWSLSLFTLKASYLVKWPISTWSFMWWCQFINRPLHDPVTWCKITYTGEQVAQWDFQNNAPAFVLEVPLRNLLTSETMKKIWTQ